MIIEKFLFITWVKTIIIKQSSKKWNSVRCLQWKNWKLCNMFYYVNLSCSASSGQNIFEDVSVQFFKILWLLFIFYLVCECLFCILYMYLYLFCILYMYLYLFMNVIWLNKIICNFPIKYYLYCQWIKILWLLFNKIISLLLMNKNTMISFS